MTMRGQEKPELEELLHFGVMGMKWGKHNTKAGPPTQRQKMRALNKDSKARDKSAHNATVDAARLKYDTKARANYLKAKAQYQVDKNTIGSREARKKFDAVKQKNIDLAAVASQTKHGKETAMVVLGVVGAVALSVLVSSVRLPGNARL